MESHMLDLLGLEIISTNQGRIQDLWLGGGGGGGVSRRGVWGPLKVPSGSRAELWGFEELQTFI